jgi:Tol biopolymer transport system component
LTFSPDGNSVYFVRSRTEIGSFKDLYATPVLGGHARLWARDIDSPVSFSPDGRQFVYTQGFPDGNNRRIANADGSDLRQAIPCVMADFDNYAAFPKFLVIIFACGSLRVCFSLRS